MSVREYTHIHITLLQSWKRDKSHHWQGHCVWRTSIVYTIHLIKSYFASNMYQNVKCVNSLTQQCHFWEEYIPRRSLVEYTNIACKDIHHGFLYTIKKLKIASLSSNRGLVKWKRQCNIMQSSKKIIRMYTWWHKKKLHVTLLSKKKVIKEYSWYDFLNIKQFLLWMAEFQFLSTFFLILFASFST